MLKKIQIKPRLNNWVIQYGVFQQLPCPFQKSNKMRYHDAAFRPIFSKILYKARPVTLHLNLKFRQKISRISSFKLKKSLSQRSFWGIYRFSTGTCRQQSNTYICSLVTSTLFMIQKKNRYHSPPSRGNILNFNWQSTGSHSQKHTYKVWLNSMSNFVRFPMIQY